MQRSVQVCSETYADRLMCEWFAALTSSEQVFTPSLGV
jgi:hypothetical protein